MWILFFIIFLIFNKIPLTTFQFLLLICFIEVKTGVFIGDLYWSLILFSYLFYRYTWYKTIHAPVVQSG